MSLGIAFEGCAGRSAFSAGVAMQLRDMSVMPGLISGASSGAIVAAFAAARKTEYLEDAWLSAAGRPVFQPQAMLELKWPFRMSEMLRGALREVFGSQRLDELPQPVAMPVTLVGISGRVRRVLTRSDPIPVVDAVLASCFIPGPYSEIVRIDHQVAFDGAWQARIPLDDVRALGARQIIAVSGHPRDTLARGYPFVHHSPLPGHCRIIRPGSALALGGYDTDAGRIRDAMQAGRQAAEAFVEGQRGWLDQGP
jgi:NTE family protein